MIRLKARQETGNNQNGWYTVNNTETRDTGMAIHLPEKASLCGPVLTRRRRVIPMKITPVGCLPYMARGYH